MPRKPAVTKASLSSKEELFGAGEIESVLPELSEIQRENISAAKPTRPKHAPETRSYRHPEATTPMRPEVGTQDRFSPKEDPSTYSYDPSLSPQLHWAGKAERLSFNVPTLPLFIHERLSTKAILETLRSHRRSDEEQLSLVENLFGDPRHSEADQLLKSYSQSDPWVNRMILGDALVAMNSLLRHESLAGQVQMIYVDPPYGVNYGSNFQPFVRNRNVAHGDDEDLTREPEMVQAYRDTWELGVHSYLTYLRDRLLLSRELLAARGSIFVQISHQNVHHVRELMDEVFGPENFCALITYRTSVALTSNGLGSVSDYLIWYARDKSRYKFHDLFVPREVGEKSRYSGVELLDGTRRALTAEEKGRPELIPAGGRVFADMDLASSGYTASCTFDFPFNGKVYRTSSGKSWKTTRAGMEKLAASGRITDSGKTIRYIIYHDDFPVTKLTNFWQDTTGELDKSYVVQTHSKIIQRCMLMTTDPGELVLDPTCGSGTTAYVAEQWGRRWITMDVSRVPLALARQRLLTASFPWYQLKDESRGPGGGFIYKRKRNQKREEVGGIVPKVTLGSIANNEPPTEEVLLDRPEVNAEIVRVCGPFNVEATIPTPVDYDPASPISDGAGEGNVMAGSENYSDFVARMIEVLRRSPVIRLDGGRSVTLKNVRPPAKGMSLNAEAIIPNGNDKLVAFVFGPENGAVSSKLVSNAAREAYQKSYAHLYVIGFAIQPDARKFVEACETVGGISATYVQATPDLVMGDLLKNMRSSHIFSVCGLPEIRVGHKKAHKDAKTDFLWEVELLGLDVFDPVTMETDKRNGNDVPAWFLDTDYNGLVFKVRQAFFPRTSAWENLRKELKAEFDDSVWEHLAGTTSEPFQAGEHRTIAVKVIDDRGNELLVVKELSK